MNILPARADANGNYEVNGLGAIVATDITTTAQKTNQSFIAIRPEKLFIAGDDNDNDIHKVSAIVDNVAYYGGETVVTVTTKNQSGKATLTVCLPNNRRNANPPASGDNITVAWRAEDVIALQE